MIALWKEDARLIPILEKMLECYSLMQLQIMKEEEFSSHIFEEFKLFTANCTTTVFSIRNIKY
jgi:hypothetical protein